MEDNNLIFKRIELLLNANRMTLKGLCESAGVNYGGFRKARESGNITISTLTKIAKALDVPLSSFFLDTLSATTVVKGHSNTQRNENSPGSKNVLVINRPLVEPDPNVVNENPYSEAPPQEEKGKYESTYQLLAQCQKQNEALTIAIKNMEKTIQLLEERNKQG